MGKEHTMERGRNYIIGGSKDYLEPGNKKRCRDFKELMCGLRNAVWKFVDSPEVLSVTSPHVAISDNHALASEAKCKFGPFSSPALPIKAIYY